MMKQFYVQPSAELLALMTEDVITASGENAFGFKFTQSGAGISDVTPGSFNDSFEFDW